MCGRREGVVLEKGGMRRMVRHGSIQLKEEDGIVLE